MRGKLLKSLKKWKTSYCVCLSGITRFIREGKQSTEGRRYLCPSDEFGDVSGPSVQDGFFDSFRAQQQRILHVRHLYFYLYGSPYSIMHVIIFWAGLCAWCAKYNMYKGVWMTWRCCSRWIRLGRDNEIRNFSSSPYVSSSRCRLVYQSSSALSLNTVRLQKQLESRKLKSETWSGFTFWNKWLK